MDRQHLANLSPPDAAVALRSYVRRFGSLLRPSDLTGDVPLGVAVLRGWSVHGLLRAADGYLAGLETAMRRGLDEAGPVLGTTTLERPEPSAVGAEVAGPSTESPGVAALLDAVTAAFGRSADRVARTPTKDWDRPLTIGTRPTTVHEILRELVAYGRTALDELTAVIEAARLASA